MGNPGKSRIAVAVVLAMAAAACHRGEDSKQLAALDSALKAGVITKSEYDAKKSALAQLAALDKARDAGVLTPAEYQDRKQKLTAVVPLPAVPDETPASPGAANSASEMCIRDRRQSRNHWPFLRLQRPLDLSLIHIFQRDAGVHHHAAHQIDGVSNQRAGSRGLKRQLVAVSYTHLWANTC